MKIGVLTSSRADFGIYQPLLKLLQSDSFFELEIIAFGTHLSEKHGYTINEIKKSGFPIQHQIETIPLSDSPSDISMSIGKTIEQFAPFWVNNTFDLVFALGDRFEMFAAVTAATPIGVKFAHIHAGETTLGAIDNAYRHSISLMSKYLFVSTEKYAERANQIIETNQYVYNVGALSIDNLSSLDLYSINEFKKRFDIDLNRPTILSTFHPETVSYKKNETYINELIESFKILKNKYQIVITMPNADTMGNMIRKKLLEFKTENKEIHLVESFGMIGYLSCMKYCSFLLGNTSSGFVEASFFPKHVINLGNRQKGRIISNNIVSVPVICENILSAIKKIENNPTLRPISIYGDGCTSEKIVRTLKELPQ